MKFMKIISLFFVVILYSNCDEKNKEPLYSLMQQEFKDYTVFTKGDYWVYMNNVGVKGSIVLIKQLFLSYKEKQQNYYRDLLLQCYVRNLNDTFVISADIFGDKNCTYFYGKGEYDVYIFYPFFKNETTFNNTTMCNGFIDSIIIANTTYYNILVFENKNNNFSNTKLYYYSKNIGLLKKIEFDNTVWELVNYNTN